MAVNTQGPYDQLGIGVTLPCDPTTGPTQNQILALASTGIVAAASTGAAGFVGVNRDLANPPGKVGVWTSGIVSIYSGGAINPGDKVTSDSSGRAVTYTPSASGATSITHVGTALTSATGAGTLVCVLLNVGAPSER